MKILSSGHTPESSFATSNAPVDLVYILPSLYKIKELKVLVERSNVCRRFFPKFDCKEAKRKRFFGSLLITN